MNARENATTPPVPVESLADWQGRNVLDKFTGLPSFDAGAELSANDEEDAYTLSGLAYEPPAPGARRLARR